MGTLFGQDIRQINDEVIVLTDSQGKRYYMNKTAFADAILPLTSAHKLNDDYGYVLKEYTIDASSLDEDTWYPVTMSVSCWRNVRIELIVALDGSAPSWSTHPTGGFSCRAIWEVNGYGYGTTRINRTIYEFDTLWVKTDACPMGGIGQLGNSSLEYIFVRGGGKYSFRISHNVVPLLQRVAFTAQGESLSPITTKPTQNRRTYARIEELNALEARIKALEDK